MSTSFSDPKYSVEDYMDHRPRYPRELYEAILEFHHQPIDGHHQPGPQTDLALDLGCGPGIATRQLLPFFDKVIGVDDSERMIRLAKSSLPEAEFHVGSANVLPMIQAGTVDLLTAAKAAHWFPFDWWQEAGRVVKPGGTIAVWVYSEKMIIEPSHPKSQELSQVLAGLVDQIGMDTPGNKHAAELYDSLPLPACESQFSPVKRITWNREGSDNKELFMSSRFTIESLRKRMSTYSPVYRWRAQNPSKANTPDDPVEKVFTNLKNLAGWDESTEFITGYPLCLIMMKKL